MHLRLSAFTDEQLSDLVGDLPHWHASIVGPFGSKLSRDFVLRKTLREVSHLLFEDAREADEEAGREHDPDQWRLVDVSTCNCN